VCVAKLLFESLDHSFHRYLPFVRPNEGRGVSPAASCGLGVSWPLWPFSSSRSSQVSLILGTAQRAPLNVPTVPAREPVAWSEAPHGERPLGVAFPV